jgi:Uma2 family endonuclease
MERKEKSLTPEEYLEIERESGFKSDYFNGERFPLSGAGYNHNLITLNLAAFLLNRLKDKNCFVFSNDMRLFVESQKLYTYPDVMVISGEIKFPDRKKDTVLNPILIIEVISKNTESYDRGKKFEFYRSIPSLKEYVMVSSDHYLIEVYSKNINNSWVLADEKKPEALVKFTSLSLQVQLKEIYLKVEFED